MDITPDRIFEMEAGGIDPRTLKWLCAQPRTLREVEGANPIFGLDMMRASAEVRAAISPEFVRHAARMRPDLALRWCWEWLPDDVFDRCVLADPHYALEFALPRLSRTQFNDCVRLSPHSAWRWARDRLNKRQLARCERVARCIEQDAKIPRA